jgi:hypothetical protein
LTVDEVFRRVTSALERVGIPYMLTGSFASSYHGVVRATQDIDLVISPTTDQIRALIKLLPEAEYYADENAALEAQRLQRQFNVIDRMTGWKIDLIFRKSRPFSLREFERRETVDFHGMSLAIATVEDVLLAKLEWAKRGGSQRQIEDAAAILRIRAGGIDLQYIREWTKELQISEQWHEACRIAGIPF